MANRKDIIIDDDYINQIGNLLKTRCKSLDDTYARYIGIMSEIRDDAIKTGDTHDAVAEYVRLAEELKQKIEDIGGCAHVTMGCFVGDIDDADKYLY